MKKFLFKENAPNLIRLWQQDSDALHSHTIQTLSWFVYHFDPDSASTLKRFNNYRMDLPWNPVLLSMVPTQWILMIPVLNWN